jgi:toxin YhaV
VDLILVEAPRDPNAAEFQLGDTFGPAYRHWRRKKFLGDFGFTSGSTAQTKPSSRHG